jgi:hypothetical protein
MVCGPLDRDATGSEVATQLIHRTEMDLSLTDNLELCEEPMPTDVSLHIIVELICRRAVRKGHFVGCQTGRLLPVRS